MPTADSNHTRFEATASNGQRKRPLPPDEEAQASSFPDLDSPDWPYAGFSWTEGAIITGACVLFTTIMFVTTLTSSCCAPSSHAEMMRGITGRLSYLFLWALSTLPVFWACVRLRPRRVGWGAVLAGHTLLALGIAFAVEWGQNVILTGILTLWPPSDPPNLALHPVDVLTGLQFLGELVPYLILLIIGLGRYEYLRSRARRAQAERLERQAERLRTQLTSARLEALRMQINPHFLFNTLHTIATMAGSNPEGVQKATARLSEMLRYALSTSDQQEVPLVEELDMLNNYLELQKLRLEERLETHVDVDPDARRALVPTLLLQPLAENAVKHGFEEIDAPGRLDVRARREAGDLVLRVADNGAGLPNASKPVEATELSARSDEGHGLTNIAERLKGLYGEAASLRFERSTWGGLAVVIRLPFHTRETESNLRVTAIETE